MTGKAENHPPVCANRHGPTTFHFALERMQPETRYIHVGHNPGRVETRENVTQFNDVFGDHAARIVIFVETFQPLVTYRLYQPVP